MTSRTINNKPIVGQCRRAPSGLVYQITSVESEKRRIILVWTRMDYRTPSEYASFEEIANDPIVEA
jgi:hypothetical protein